MKVSVAMTLYNGASHLKEQLDSLASQTRPPDELVVCDDCSTDDSANIVREFASNVTFPVQIHVNASNRGEMLNYEKAVSLSTGDVIFFCDWDDVWMPHKIEQMEGVFRQSPEVGVAQCDGLVTDEQLRSLGREWRLCGFNRRAQRLLEQGIFRGLLSAPFAGHGMAFRSRFKHIVLPFPVKYIEPSTWVGTLVGCYSNVALVKEPLVKYRRHGKQLSAGLLELTPRQKLGLSISRPRAVHAALRSETTYQRVFRGSHGFVPRRNVLLDLEQWRDHSASRVRMSPRRVLRLPIVLRELLSLRYHRYSGGLFSVAKDLVVR
jgi:glycosyltransferase involved in cell wall biosynthesis